MGLLFLQITDGATTCAIADGSGGATSYRLVYDKWEPQIAGLNLGDVGPVYQRVQEDLTLDVHGTSVANAYANAQALVQLLHQAARWARGENVNPVLCKFSPTEASVSSAASPLQAKIWEGTVELNSAVLDPVLYVLRGVRVKFTRDGEWMHTTETVSTGTGTTPTVLTASFTAVLKTISKIKATIAVDLDVAYNQIYEPVFVWYAPGSDRIKVIEAEAATVTKWTSVADASNYASGGNVLRYTPTDTNESISGALNVPSMASGARRFAIYAAVRNNSASVSWLLRTLLFPTGYAGEALSTRPIVIDNSITTPRIVCLGSVAMPTSLASMALAATAASTSGSPTLDIDWVLVQAIDDRRCGCVALYTLNQSTAGGDFSIVLDPQELTKPSAAHYISQSGALAFYNASGHEAIVEDGNAIALAIAGFSRTYPAYWSLTDNTRALQLGASLVRRNAYLIGE